MSDFGKNDHEDIYSKVLRAGRRTYFFDVRSTKADDYYLTVTESKKFTHDDGTFHYQKHKIYLYKEDFSDFHEMLKKDETDDIPYKKVLCAEFRGHDHNIAYSKLFGHKKGAYSGADNDYIGMIKEADGGIVFLDEIADIPMETQNILLDVIEGKPFRPLKSNDEVTSEFQLICATNRKMDEIH